MVQQREEWEICKSENWASLILYISLELDLSERGSSFSVVRRADKMLHARCFSGPFNRETT